MIAKLDKNQIFVFGSNLAGAHTGGAARQARESFGAEEGVGEGMTGRCYAFPTLDGRLNQRSNACIEKSVVRLYECCLGNPESEFLLTKVGCGIAGMDEEYMRSLFENPPKNLIPPDDWK